MNKPCNRCGGRNIITRPGAERADAVVCTHMADCPTCGGYGWRQTVSGRYEASGPCPCGLLRAAKRTEAYRAANIPAMYASASLASGTCDGRQDAEAARVAGALLVERIRDGAVDRGLGIVGPMVADCEAIAAAVAANTALRTNVQPLWVDCGTLLERLRAAVAERRPSAGMLAEVDDAGLLVLVGLGLGLGTEWEMSVIDGIISRRYSRGKPLVWVSGYRFDGARPQLTARIGERAASRLREMTEVVEVVDGHEWGTKKSSRQGGSVA